MLSELLAKTPIVRGEGAASAAPGAGGGFDYVDENVDPELAATLKLSLETEEAERKARGTSGEPESTPAAANSSGANDVNMDEDPELAEALRQSLLSNTPPTTTTDETLPEDDEDDEFARAMALSQQSAIEDREKDEKKPLLADHKESQEKPAEPTAEETDPEYLSSVFLSLPDIDPNDPEVKALLEQMRQEKDKDAK